MYMYICIHMCVCVYIYIHIYCCFRLCFAFHVWVCIHIYMYVCMYVYSFSHTCFALECRVRSRQCTIAHMYSSTAHVHVYVIHTYIHTYIRVLQDIVHGNTGYVGYLSQHHSVGGFWTRFALGLLSPLSILFINTIFMPELVHWAVKHFGHRSVSHMQRSSFSLIFFFMLVSA